VCQSGQLLRLVPSGDGCSRRTDRQYDSLVAGVESRTPCAGTETEAREIRQL